MKRNVLTQYLIITASCALYAVGFNWMFDPNHISVGGFTGLGQIINYLLPGLPIGTIVIIRPAEEEKPAQQPNPSTGANDVVAAAVALMAVSALGMAVLTRKK